MNAKPSVEETVKQQFARQFKASDWKLFKQMAEFYFQNAVFLKKDDIDHIDKRLLARNCLKRLYIGIGTELLLKAIYLKHGFEINRLDGNPPGAPHFPFTTQQAQGFRLSTDGTYMLAKLIDGLSSVLPVLGSEAAILRGLKIAKVFRNKEGHTIFPKQKFEPQNYSDIEKSLAALYASVFNESLQLRFSLTANDKGIWNKAQTGR